MLDLNLIEEEYHRSGRLSVEAVSKLRAMIVAAEDPFDAISVAADCAQTQCRDEIATRLADDDEMIRWIAAATLFTRFRSTECAERCLVMALHDQSRIVRGIAIVGLGELIGAGITEGLARTFACTLLQLFEANDSDVDTRGIVYEAIQGAAGVPVPERISSAETPDLSSVVDWQLIDGFRRRFGCDDNR